LKSESADQVNADWLGAPRLRTLRSIGVRSIKTWRVFGAPSRFQYCNMNDLNS